MDIGSENLNISQLNFVLNWMKNKILRWENVYLYILSGKRL